MKILNSKSKNFDKLLENLLLQRKKKIQSDSVSVTDIICLLYKSPSPRDANESRNPASQ